MKVTLYGRPGCHLCEDAAEELRGLARQYGLRINVVDITTDRQAHDRWWADVPVVQLGTTVLRAPFDGSQLRRVLLRSLRRQR